MCISSSGGGVGRRSRRGRRRRRRRRRSHRFPLNLFGMELCVIRLDTQWRRSEWRHHILQHTATHCNTLCGTHLKFPCKTAGWRLSPWRHHTADCLHGVSPWRQSPLHSAAFSPLQDSPWRHSMEAVCSV